MASSNLMLSKQVYFVLWCDTVKFQQRFIWLSRKTNWTLSKDDLDVNIIHRRIRVKPYFMCSNMISISKYRNVFYYLRGTA